MYFQFHAASSIGATWRIGEFRLRLLQDLQLELELESTAQEKRKGLKSANGSHEDGTSIGVQVAKGQMQRGVRAASPGPTGF